MINTNKLKGKIVENGYNLGSFANAINISRQSLRNKLNGASDFRASEIDKICSLLGIKTEEMETYFFIANVPVLETSIKNN